MSEPTRSKNRKVSWTWCKYLGSDLYTVRKKVEEDFCHFTTEEAAKAFVKKCEEKKDFDNE